MLTTFKVVRQMSFELNARMIGTNVPEKWPHRNRKMPL